MAKNLETNRKQRERLEDLRNCMKDFKSDFKPWKGVQKCYNSKDRANPPTELRLGYARSQKQVNNIKKP